MTIEIKRHHWREDYKDFPHTGDELLAAKALRGWHYRCAWPTHMWQLDYPGRPTFDHVCDLPEIDRARKRWCDDTFVSQDNHQAFLVELASGFKVFVFFHDGGVYLGEKVRLDLARRAEPYTVEEVLTNTGHVYGQFPPREPYYDWARE